MPLFKNRTQLLAACLSLILTVGILAIGWRAWKISERFFPEPTPLPRPTATKTAAPFFPLTTIISGLSLVPAPSVIPPTLDMAEAPAHRLPELARFGNGWPGAAAFSPDGKRMALATSTGVQMYDISLRKIAAVYESSSPVYAVSFSPEGRWLAAGQQDGNIKVLDPATLLPVDSLLSRNSPVRSLAFTHPESADAVQWLAAGYQNGTIAVWDLASRAVILQVGDPLLGYWGYGIRSLAFSKGDQWLVAGGDQGYVSSWRLSDGQPRSIFQTQHGLLFGLAFSPDGQTLASACSDGTVQLWDFDSDTPGRLLTGHMYGAWSVAFSPNGATLAVGDGDGHVHLWDALRGVEQKSAPATSGSVDTVLFAPDGGSLVVVSSGQKASLLHAEDLSLVDDFSANLGALRSISIASDQSLAVLTGETGNAYLWDLRAGRAFVLGPAHMASNAGMTAALSPDNHWLAVADGWLNLLRIYSNADPALNRDVPVGKVRALAFEPSGGFLAAAGRELVILNLDDDQIQRFDLTGNATSLAFLGPAAGRLRLAVGLDTGAVELWDLSSGAVAELIPAGGQPIWSLAGHGNWLAVADNGGAVRIWDVTTGRLQIMLSGNSSPAISLAFSPDGTRLGAGGLDGAITIWTVPDGKVRAVFRGHAGWVNGLAFSADGKMLLSAGADGTARIWGMITH
jgi:WD40 repeat protein